MLTETLIQSPIENSIESPALSAEEKHQEVYQVAAKLFQQQPDWVTFFREVLGINGLVRQAFPESAEFLAFEQTTQFARIQQMLAKLRDEDGKSTQHIEPTRVITVRLPKSLHESLRTEAHERQTSMNQLCISKLLQIVDEQLANVA